MKQAPNILIIMSDQHHAGVMGCAGDGVIQTPNLDRLTAKGVRFTNAYCPSPLCGPSRMSFMTGRHPHEIQVWGNQDVLRSDIPTFAHAFHAAGYDTVLSGRMHFVGEDQRHGFAERLIGDVSPTAYIMAGWQLDKVVGDLADTCGMSLNGLLKSGPGRTGYQAYDEAVTARTVDWLQERTKRDAANPFLLTVGYVTPHCPFVAPPDDFAYYRDKITASNLPDAKGDLHPRNTRLRQNGGVDTEPPVDAQWRTRVAYYGLTTFLDRQVGAVVSALESAGLVDDTIIVYCSDHGEMLGEHGMWWKSTFYEGACRVPLIISVPGNEEAVRTKNVSLMDVGATLADLAGIDPLPSASGRSLRPVLEGSEEREDVVFAEYEADVVCRMVRSGAWKYNYYHGMEPELFNLQDDPAELCNLAGSKAYRETEARLRDLVLADWNPEAIQDRVKTDRAEMRALAERLKTSRPPEPDPPWFTSKPDNWVDDTAAPIKESTGDA